MSRIIELTELHLSDSLTDEQSQEYLTLLETKADGFEEAMILIQTDGLLQAMLSETEVSSKVMNEIRQAKANVTADAVMQKIRKKKNVHVKKPNLRSVRRRDKISPYPIFFSIAAILLIGFFIFNGLKKVPEAPIALVEEINGAALVLRDNQKINLEAGDGLESGDQLVSEGQLSIQLSDKSTLQLSSSTDVSISRQNNSWNLSLVKGKVTANVAPQRGTFVVKTKDLNVRVIGTKFSVEMAEQASLVKVTEGQVESIVEGVSKKFIIEAGQEFKAQDKNVIFQPRKISNIKKTILSFDFENNKLPQGNSNSKIVSKFPQGNTSTYVAQGILGKQTGKDNKLKGFYLEKKNGIFTYQKNLVIRFDYWMNSKCFWLGVWARTDNGNLNVYKALSPSFNKWATAELPLKELISQTNGQTLKVGDIVSRLHLMTNGSLEATIYIDNISIFSR